MKASGSVAYKCCFTLLFSFLLSTYSIKAQNRCKETVDTLTGKKVYEKYDVEPEYKDGAGAMQRFIITNFDSSKNEPWQSTYSIVFIVDKDGSVIAPRIHNKPVNEYSDGEHEMIRVFLQMPRWHPGRCGETTVACIFKTPIVIDPLKE
ncbi:MAG TPA: hypothetical protein VGO21_03920 [Candidatus Paceibacterota bacterium]|jgi:hypothetical protein|nr:hypothetical protein [Candidatus Paceibacterota bacterium]